MMKICRYLYQVHTGCAGGHGVFVIALGFSDREGGGFLKIKNEMGRQI